jgi:hypothetical protein
MQVFIKRFTNYQKNLKMFLQAYAIEDEYASFNVGFL